MTGVTSGAGTAYPSRAPEFTLFFSGVRVIIPPLHRRWGMLFLPLSVRPSVDKSYVVRLLELCFLESFLKFYQLFTGEESRIPFIFDDFHFCRSRVIGLDMTKNRIFILCRMITWVVFLRMFWNFISSLPMKRGGSLSFLTIFTFVVPELLDLIWRKIGFLPYVVW